MKVSVIIPVYNTALYLQKCIDSVLSQTYEDFELLLIDDGSTDGSGTICDDYAIQDQRVRVFHKENGGVSSARNLGIDNAKGEWLTFVDSDDCVEDAYLYDFNVNSDFDFFIQGMRNVGKSKNFDFSFENESSSKYTFLNKYTLHPFFSGPTAKLFNRNILKNSRFDKNISLGEDTLFVLEYINKIERIKTIDKNGYFYINRTDSLTNQERDFKEMKILFSKVELLLSEIFGDDKRMIARNMRIITLLTFNSIYSKRNSMNAFEKYREIKSIPIMFLKEIFDEENYFQRMVKFLLNVRAYCFLNIIFCLLR